MGTGASAEGRGQAGLTSPRPADAALGVGSNGCGSYRAIVADPPWPYSPQRTNLTAKSERGLKIADHYESMSIDGLCDLQPPSADDAHLYFWTTNAFMVEAHEIVRAWGFEPKTICTYVKVCKNDPTRVSRKTGYWFRGATEHFLFCVRGSMKLQTSEALPTAYLWPRLPHSVKPDQFYDLVEKASPGPYLELFARRERLGWDTWGDQSANSSGLDLTPAVAA